MVLTPQQVRHAYGFDRITLPNGSPGTGADQTIAIVTATDNPSIAEDLKQFDRAFGLPDPSLSVVNLVPPGSPIDPSWALETALDVEWAHAVAPGANLLLVEAASANLNDLLNAVDVARSAPGVSVVSMSWGSDEFSSELYYDGHFTTPADHGGVTFVAAAGDDGARYGAMYPAVSPYVLSIGGTTLWTAGSSGTYAAESAWSGGGGGYSRYEGEPSYQAGVQLTGVRTTPDVAHNADPNSGVYVYDEINGGWFFVGGTSAGTPQWAGLVAIADQGLAAVGRGSLANAQNALYRLPSSAFYDITTGGNGYAATAGYDLATGLGTPLADRVVGGLLAALGVGSAPTATGSTALSGSRGRVALRAALTSDRLGVVGIPSSGSNSPAPGDGSGASDGVALPPPSDFNDLPAGVQRVAPPAPAGQVTSPFTSTASTVGVGELPLARRSESQMALALGEVPGPRLTARIPDPETVPQLPPPRFPHPDVWDTILDGECLRVLVEADPPLPPASARAPDAPALPSARPARPASPVDVAVDEPAATERVATAAAAVALAFGGHRLVLARRREEGRPIPLRFDLDF